jgi:hypothetical protein
MDELGLRRGLILTEDDEGILKLKRKTIEIRPIYRWLLE